MTSTEVFNRIKKNLGFRTDKELAERLEVPLRRLQTWKSRNTMRFHEILQFCEKEDIDLNTVFFDRISDKPGALSLEPFQNETRGSATVFEPTNCILPPKNRLDMYELNSDQIVDTIHISAEWAQHVLGLTAKKVALIRVVGNNMAPWVTDGDLVIIDTTNTAIVSDAPYALLYNSVIVVKRLLRQFDGTITARSDSQYCEDEQFADDTALPKILGRVIRRIVR